MSRDPQHRHDTHVGHSRPATTNRRCALAAALAAAVLAGCAGPRVDGTWASPELAGRSLQARTVLVECRALDPTVRSICADRLAVGLQQRGAKPASAPIGGSPSAGSSAGPMAGGEAAVDERARLAAARAVGAEAIVTTTLMSGGPAIGGFGPTIGIGVGGGGGRFGIGGGISLPVGGMRAGEAYAASTSVLDAGSGQPLWSIRVSTAASTDVAGQVDELLRTTIEAMAKAGLL